VAVIAAVVSFAHIESLALANGYTIGTARLLPFSVDGLLLASSLSLAAGGRPWLSRVGLVLGVAATVAANVVFGVQFGAVGALVNAWPAISFVVSSEILVGMMRGTRDLPSADETELDSATEAPIPSVSTLETVADVVPADALEDVPETEVARTAPPVPVRVPKTVPSGRAPTRARVTGVKTPERVFAAEIDRGELPSLRAVKERMHVGTDRARVIRDGLASTMQEAVSRAA
jgi:hypothetical protein